MRNGEWCKDAAYEKELFSSARRWVHRGITSPVIIYIPLRLSFFFYRFWCSFLLSFCSRWYNSSESFSQSCHFRHVASHRQRRKKLHAIIYSLKSRIKSVLLFYQNEQNKNDDRKYEETFSSISDDDSMIRFSFFLLFFVLFFAIFFLNNNFFLFVDWHTHAGRMVFSGSDI